MLIISKTYAIFLHRLEDYKHKQICMYIFLNTSFNKGTASNCQKYSNIYLYPISLKILIPSKRNFHLLSMDKIKSLSSINNNLLKNSMMIV